MANDVESELRDAMIDFLKLFNIKLDLAKPATDEERYSCYEEMLAKTQAKLNELNTKADDILQQTGMTKEEIEAYGANQRNFTPEQWKALQRVKEAADNLKTQARQYLGVERMKMAKEHEKKEEVSRFVKKKKKKWMSV